MSTFSLHMGYGTLGGISIARYYPSGRVHDANLLLGSPDGDFIVSYHPDYEGLFLATGGSGHAYKFFPVLGDKVVDAMEGTLDPELQKLWEWTEANTPAPGTNMDDLFDGDGSRSGARNSNLQEELAKTRKASRESAL